MYFFIFIAVFHNVHIPQFTYSCSSWWTFRNLKWSFLKGSKGTLLLKCTLSYNSLYWPAFLIEIRPSAQHINCKLVHGAYLFLYELVSTLSPAVLYCYFCLCYSYTELLSTAFSLCVSFWIFSITRSSSSLFFFSVVPHWQLFSSIVFFI